MQTRTLGRGLQVPPTAWAPWGIALSAGDIATAARIGVRGQRYNQIHLGLVGR